MKMFKCENTQILKEKKNVKRKTLLFQFVYFRIQFSFKTFKKTMKQNGNDLIRSILMRKIN